MANSKFKIQNSELNSKKVKTIELPLTKKIVCSLRVGDMVLIKGKLITGRDKIHKFLFKERPSKRQMPFNLEGMILYHCGPIIKKIPKGFELIAAGPTTSMRVEMYENFIISKYGVRGVMGKGGMGGQTLNALKENGCVYLHTIGGAAVYLADRVKRIVDVWKLDEFGMTEAMWVFDVEEFPAIVTMDAHGRNLHEEIEKRPCAYFQRMISSKKFKPA